MAAAAPAGIAVVACVALAAAIAAVAAVRLADTGRRDSASAVSTRNHAATFVGIMHMGRPAVRSFQEWAILRTAPRMEPARRVGVRCSAYQGWKRYEGWNRLNDRRSWDFLLGASPFSYEEVVANAKREGYMDNLIWVDTVLEPDSQEVGGERGDGSGNSTSAEYPAAFISYLSRLLLSRDEHCARWWAGANAVSDEPPELLFARFEASVAQTLSRKWSGRAGALAASLIKRFGGRFPFDALQQTQLLFSLLPEEIVRDSFFDQEFNTDRDELMEVFLVMDTDGNGVLNSQEIGDALKAIGGWISTAEIQEMLADALANSDGEVDFAGFKEAIIASHKAPRRRLAQGIPDTEWWRDPAALIPADLLDMATSVQLVDAHNRFQVLTRLNVESDALQEPQMTRTPPLMRERPLGGAVYLLFMVAGAFACTLTHTALVPIDVVKTLHQTEPVRFSGLGLVTSMAKLYRESGAGGLFLGLAPTLAGYTWYGATVFPGYEFFKRRLLALCGPRFGAKVRVPLVLLSGAIATFFACIGVCPAEAVRIRTVTAHGFRMAFMQPVSSLFAGFAPLLFRQVFFGMAKFLVFDTFAGLVYRRFPGLARKRRTSLMVSLLSGATAGLVATFVSQPSDAILTRLATAPELGIWRAAQALWAEGRVAAFFAGFITRSVWAAAIIAGQFLLYDVAKQVFKVTAADLTQTADVLTTALRTREPVAAPAGPSDAGPGEAPPQPRAPQPPPSRRPPRTPRPGLPRSTGKLVLCTRSGHAGLGRSWVALLRDRAARGALAMDGGDYEEARSA